jgi:hypothetical protein
MQLQLCIYSLLIILCSTILNYIYHLCALDVVASGIDDIIVQTGVVEEQAGEESGGTGEIEDTCEGSMSLSCSCELCVG